ncbi:hypothetical protein TRAPUB_10465 [Trametes pubescens]|uniref:SUN domain-containing protein n=1 Tax=Trametes pubescens TaxID=154538 RepID=A0A1M2VZH3_TRAPU|nr:hypothetical protein TRAPUB_10465 [Trametes pubescens]
MLLSLPTSLLALLFASPVLSGPTTPNDLFHDIAVLAPKQPEEPVCCLRPLSPLESPSEDDLLLSFEEWKTKRLSDATEREPIPAQSAPQRPAENASRAVVPDATPHHTDAQGTTISSDVQESAGAQEIVPSHLQIPIHDRFNYASLDCSARVHAAHKTSKSPSSILSSKKDRYMLSPCAEQKQFVIVELCEDIRIDTVQLANYEFFSGVFKDFTVSVSKKYYPNDPESWTFAGTYRAKNARGVQSFHPPPTLRGFYRFIRIDFHSHYGNEYYCPLSLLRVYGLTHLEEWQWETWDAESRAKRSIEEASSPVEVVAEPPMPLQAPVLEQQVEEKSGPLLVVSDDIPPSPGFSTESMATVTSDTSASAHDGPLPSSYTLELIPKTADPHVGAHHQAHTETLSSTPKTSAPADSMSNDPSRPPTDSLYNTKTATIHSSASVFLSQSSLASSSSSHIQSQNLSTASDNHSTIFIDTHSDSSSHSASSHSSSNRSSAASPHVSSLSVMSPSYSPPAPPASTGGESIYRLIMNRLTALEANTTLYARYVEEQTAGMREVLRRLSEDIGRLESIGKTQAQLYQRSVVELQKQTRRLESEHKQLVSHVNHLTDEVVLEKRLGIAQLTYSWLEGRGGVPQAWVNYAGVGSSDTEHQRRLG